MQAKRTIAPLLSALLFFSAPVMAAEAIPGHTESTGALRAQELTGPRPVEAGQASVTPAGGQTEILRGEEQALPQELLQPQLSSQAQEPEASPALGASQAPAKPAPSLGGCVIMGCISQLPAEKRGRAEAILGDMLPGLRSLDSRISIKMQELGELTFDSEAGQAKLPELGLELQLLREELLRALTQVNLRLLSEVGVQAPVPQTRGMRGMRGVLAEQPAQAEKAEQGVAPAPQKLGDSAEPAESGQNAP